MNKGYGDAGASWHKKVDQGLQGLSAAAPRRTSTPTTAPSDREPGCSTWPHPIATSAIRTNRTNVVGIGLQLKSRIDREALGMTQEAADAWQAQAEREFNSVGQQ